MKQRKPYSKIVSFRVKEELISPFRSFRLELRVCFKKCFAYAEISFSQSLHRNYSNKQLKATFTLSHLISDPKMKNKNRKKLAISDFSLSILCLSVQFAYKDKKDSRITSIGICKQNFDLCLFPLQPVHSSLQKLFHFYSCLEL